MRITAFLCFIGVLQVYALPTVGQGVSINLKMKNSTLKDVLREIEENSDYHFFYQSEDLSGKSLIDIDVTQKTVFEVLEDVLPPLELKYEVFDKYIAIKSNDGSPENDNLMQQQKTISGRVTDDIGDPLPGVSVVIKGTVQGTITHKDGRYTLSNVPADATLQFSFIGMTTQEIFVGNQLNISVKMLPDAISLDEVVAIGYGTQRRSEITGSVSTVKVENLVAQPTADLEGMLKGSIPGLYVTSGNVRPGATSSVLLRGTSSLKGGNEPLYVIDGVPVENIQDLNINDIENISVLKDASAQGIYGSRAANGVILITTKRGKNLNGKVSVSYNGYISYQNMAPNFRVFNGDEYVAVRREGGRSDNANAENGWIGTYQPDENLFSDFEMELLENQEYSDWYQYAFNENVPITKHDISLFGGDDKTQYKASLGLYDQSGMRPHSGYNRFTANLSLDKTISNTFKVGLSTYLTKSEQDSEAASYSDFITYTPLAKVVDEEGELVKYPLGDTKYLNPLLYNETREKSSDVYRGLFNGYLEVSPQFVKGLKYRFNANTDMRFTENNQFNSFDDPSAEGIGYAKVDNTTTINYLVENIITYNNSFWGNHNLNVTLMQGWQEDNYHRTSAIGSPLGNDFFGINSLSSALESEVQRVASSRTLLSYMGRVNYAINDKYLFNFTVRRDGSSVFGANNKWGIFPSASLGWNAHNEGFMDNVEWVNQAKIRLSYGQIGNQGISSYGSLATADSHFYVSGTTSQVGYLPGGTFANPDLRWETTTTLNTSLDFGVLQNRLFGTFEFYNKVTTDLLVNRKLPSLSGYTTMPDNLGEIQNRGVELSLTGYLISKRDLTWSVTVNYSRNKNKLIKGVLQDETTGEYIDDVANGWYIGEPINNQLDYVFDGIWQIDDDFTMYDDPAQAEGTNPGDIRVKDLDGDGFITEDGDRKFYYSDPDWMGSLNTSVKYKNFELSMDLYLVQGVDKYNAFLGNMNYGGSLGGVANGIKIDYWTPENPINDGYRPSFSSASLYRGTFAMRDASYFRIRNVTLAYTLPKSLLGNTRVRVYVAGDNLYTKTDWLGYSPEGSASTYPETRNFTAGVNIDF
ncbi:SusC/RagA family TonB-linked outer membrane protein [Geofilum sp. OHC36d9]|uniref:SusC/RagA family TonB-linked outer membrane protein n=1 Tax=Geofilum sp. OHC36d9 TaxID=3458413 RepID=UPI004034C228